MASECFHEHIDMASPTGPGYVRCADCGKSVPVERALLSLDRKIAFLHERLRSIEEHCASTHLKGRDST